MEKHRHTRVMIASSERLIVWSARSKDHETDEPEKVSVECPHCGKHALSVELVGPDQSEIKILSGDADGFSASLDKEFLKRGMEIMYKFKNSIVPALGIMVLVTFCSVVLPFAGVTLSGPQAAAAPTSSTQNVKVVNTTNEPVPVGGTVQTQQSGTWNVGINGTPTVGIDGTNNTVKLAAGTALPAQQSGVWNVGINGTPSVGIDQANNTVKIDPALPVSVRDVDNTGLMPFQATIFGNFADGSIVSNTMEFPPVPQGKRLVVEYLSTRAAMLPGQKLIGLSLSTTFNGLWNPFDFTVNYQGSNGTQDLYVVSQQVMIRAQPGTVLEAIATRDSSVGFNFNSVYVTLSGYYLDAQ